MLISEKFRRGKYYLPVICLALLIFIVSSQNSKGQDTQKKLKHNFSFVENKGQWEPNVLFLAYSKSLRVWITDNSMVFEQFEKRNNEVINKKSFKEKEIHGYAISLEFKNSKSVIVEKIKQCKTKLNYFIGNDKSKHKTGVMQYEEVLLKGIYDGIDIRFYFDKGEVRYDYRVMPYADPSQIELEIKGSLENKLENGELVMKTSLEPVVKQGLYAYQSNSESSIQTVNSSFVLNGNRLKLNINDYNKAKELIIDPLTLVESYIITNTDYPEYLYDMTLDSNGDIYFCGEVYGEYFPLAQGDYNGYWDAIIGKLDADLSSYEWMTFFGGLSAEWASAIEVDENFIYFVGATASDEISFPLMNPIFDDSIKDSVGTWYWNNFFAVLNKDNYELKLATYLESVQFSGGNTDPDLKVSSSGNVYITGGTNRY